MDIRKVDKLNIKLTKVICKLPLSTLNNFTQLPRETFGIKVYSFLPRYATSLSKQLTQTLNDLGQLGQIHQGLVKYVASKYGCVKYLPLLKHQACARLPTYDDMIWAFI